ncbi:hypothetical protein GCM10022214_82880 [Actinomadura miaoliensis]|uniref:VCBS repeat-containing protein n=1 Tax=Actinomadura miaoliensis TaxID=430685 RepID=A0ABP7X4B7_9ACTN
MTVLDPLTRAARRLTQATPGVHGAPERFDRFGAALAAGDFDDDGVDDLAVGVPGEDDGRTPAGHSEGAVQVLHGPSMRQRAPIVSQRRPGAYDEFGAALAAGDLDGDAVADLAIGAPGRGAVRTLRGVRHRGLSERGGLRVEQGGRSQFGWALLIRDRTLYVGAPGARGFAGAVTVVSGGSSLATLPIPTDGLLGYALG